MSLPFDLELLQELTETSGVPGYEDRVRDLVVAELASEVDEVNVDSMGNVVGTLDGDRDADVVVAAHMDEIGFMIRHVTDDGFVQVDPLGGFDARVLRAQRVTVHTDDGDLTGMIGSVPPHTLDEEQLEAERGVDDIYIDLGLDGETARGTGLYR
jgi:Cellulase M and related proteins